MRKFIRLVARLVVWLLADVHVSGLENLPAQGGYVIASNHLGRLDAVLTLTLIERDDIILMIAEKYQKYAIWRFVARHIDALWLNRFEVDFKTLRQVMKRLKKGDFLAMAPEGTRSETLALQPAKHGVIFLVEKTGVPLIPVALYGTEDRALYQNLRRLRRTRVAGCVGKPYQLPPRDGKNRDQYLQEQTDELMCRIAAMLPAEYRGVYADHPRIQELLAGESLPG